MKTLTDAWTTAEVLILLVIMAFFFFDIVGVFGFAFALTGMLIAFGLIVTICIKRPWEDQVR